MSTATAPDYLQVIERLPPGTSLLAHDVPWDQYERLLAELGEAYAVRIFYDQGRMEIMSPSRKHEKPKVVIGRMLGALSDDLGIEIEPLGATTLRSELKAKGAEPDDAFYVQNAHLVAENDDIDLLNDPPPDIVLESDHTSSSLDKFAIYAGLGVPEVWRISRGRLRIFLLKGKGYKESPDSLAFPFLSSDTLNKFLNHGIERGASAAARAFLEWLREHHQQTSRER